MPVSPFSIASYLLLGAGCLLLLAGVWKAIRSRDFPLSQVRWMALADLGLCLVGFGCDGAGGGTAAVVLLAYNGLGRLLCWFSLLRLAERAGTRDREQLHGIGRSMPISAALFAFGMFACLGISPFFTPDPKPLALHAALGLGMVLVPVVLVAANCVMAVLTVLAVHDIWLGHGEYPEQAEKRSSLGLVLPFSLAGALVLMGMYGHGLVSLGASLAGESRILLPRIAADWRIASLIPFAGAFGLLGASFWKARLPAWLPAAVMGTALAAVFLEPAPTPLSRVFALVASGIGFLVALYSAGYVRRPDTGPSWAVQRYYFFLLLLFGSLNGIALSTSLGSLFIFWELMTFSSYVLVAYEGTREAHYASLKYFIMCTVAAAIMLPGLLLFSTRTGSLEMAELAGLSSGLAPGLTMAVLVLCLAGFGVKAGLFPGHSWLPDAHPAAPSSISAPLSGVLTKAGIFGLFLIMFSLFGAGRLAPELLAGTDGQAAQVVGFGWAVSCLGLLTLIYGELMALRQTDIKRILAFSTMAQVGEIALTLGLCTALAATGALMHLVNHAVMKDLLFLGTGILIMRGGSKELKDLHGLGRVMPFTAVCMIVGLLGVLGLPPFSGFMSKYLMLYAIADQSPILAGLMLLASLAGCVYYMRIIRVLLFEPYTGPELEPLSLSRTIFLGLPVGLLAALCLLMGLFPGIGLSLVGPVIAGLVQAGKLAPQAMPSLEIHWPLQSLLLLAGAFVPVFLRSSPPRAGRVSAWILVGAAVLGIFTGQGLDSFSFWFSLLIPAMGALNLFYASGYMAYSHTQWRFYAFFLTMCGGLVGVAVSQDIFNFFLFWEIMSSWSLYFVIVHPESDLALREGFKYFFYNVLGAAFLFLGVVLLSNWSGGTAWETISLALPGFEPWQIALCLGLMAVGFLMKAAQLPLRIDVQMHPAAAPTPVSGYISSVLLQSAVFGLVKLFLAVGGGAALAGAGYWLGRPELMTAVLWIGGVTIVMAATFAVFQSDIKLVLIYHSVSQLGYMIAGVALGTSLGVAGGLLHLFNHMFFKDLLFLVAGALIAQTHQRSMNRMGGLAASMPLTLGLFAIGAFCVAGLPPSNGFTSKWIIYHALMEEGHVLIAILSLVGSVLTLASFAKMLHLAFLGQPSADRETIRDPSRSMLVPMSVLAGVCLVSSLFPGLILKPINGILADLALPVLDVAPWGLASGPGAWNATTAAFLFLAAGLGVWRWLAVMTRTRRTTPIHTGGVDDPGLRMHASSKDLYSAPRDALLGAGRLAGLALRKIFFQGRGPR